MDTIFLALGDYHHVTLNTPIPPQSTGYGLPGFSIVYPDRELLRRTLIKLGWVLIILMNDNIIKDPYESRVELTYE